VKMGHAAKLIHAPSGGYSTEIRGRSGSLQKKPG
jgi:hypothetical protein